jgi:hypothetical protein
MADAPPMTTAIAAAAPTIRRDRLVKRLDCLGKLLPPVSGLPARC